jgi:hypothetical protein
MACVKRADARLDHVPRRGHARLADLEMDDVFPLGFETAGGGHDIERALAAQAGGAPGRANGRFDGRLRHDGPAPLPRAASRHEARRRKKTRNTPRVAF